MSRDRHLTAQTILEYCDGPLLFLAEDEAEAKYVCAFLRSLPDSTEFLCSRVSPSPLRKFLAGGMDLLDLITTAKLPENYLLSVSQDAQEGAPLVARRLENLSEVDSRLLPAVGYFVPPEIGSPLLSPEFAAIDAALEIDEAREEPLISTYALAEFLKIIQDLVKQGYKKAISKASKAKKKLLLDPVHYTTQVMGMGAHASFSVQFRSKESADLGQHVDLERALTKIESILKHAGDIEKTLEALKELRGHFVGAYRHLLKFLMETDGTLRLNWHAPSQGDEIKRFTVSKEFASRVESALSVMEDLAEEILPLEGFIYHVNTKTGTWKLEADDGETYAGSIEKGKKFTLEGITTKTVRYSVRCKETSKEDRLGKETKKLTLLDPPTPLPLSPSASVPPLGQSPSAAQE